MPEGGLLVELLVYRPSVPVKDFFASECFCFVKAFPLDIDFSSSFVFGVEIRCFILSCFFHYCHSLQIISSSRDTLTIDRHKALNSPLNDESNPLDQEYKIVVYFVHLR